MPPLCFQVIYLQIKVDFSSFLLSSLFAFNYNYDLFSCLYNNIEDMYGLHSTSSLFFISLSFWNKLSFTII